MSRLWAMTAYFNPAGYRTRLANYRVFRRRLAVPLVAVEQSPTGRFELGPDDADELVQVRGGDIMWQKERLLNLAIDHLPAECEYVAWLDCDIVFGRDDWAAEAVRALNGSTICQLYGTVHHLRRDTPENAIGREWSTLQHDSLGLARAAGWVTSVGSINDGVPGVYKRGHAWCVRRDCLAAHGLYDRNIVGSGDKLIAFAVTGQADDVIAYDGMTPRHADDYRAWAARFGRTFTDLTYVDGDLYHLWHGDLERRRYSERMVILRGADYDPAEDISLDASGCWRWNSAKPELHRLIREYFTARQEDGSDEAAPVAAEPPA